MTENLRMKEVQPYLEAEQAFFNRLQEALGSNLACYVVTGSLGRKQITRGWSDIDTLVIVDDYSPDIFAAIQNATKQNTSGIHIGVTLYSVKEVQRSEIFFDGKTQFALELVRSGILTPRHMDHRVDLLEPKKDVLDTFSQVELTRFLVEMKRGLTTGGIPGERMAFKNMCTILKQLQYHRGILAVSYDDALHGAKEHLHYPYQLPTVDELVTHPHAFDARKNLYINFIIWLDDYLFYSHDRFSL